MKHKLSSSRVAMRLGPFDHGLVFQKHKVTWVAYELAAGRRQARPRAGALMAEQELDALVVRAPDNVLYLTNFWGMKATTQSSSRAKAIRC